MTTLQKIIKMSQMLPISICKNLNGNKRFSTIADLGGKAMIEFYHGIGEGIAIVDEINSEIRAFLYIKDNDESIELSIETTIEEIAGLKNCVVMDCEFSATQIIFSK